jgi:glycosyltransferase involved in cell wall biosynthesis
MNSLLSKYIFIFFIIISNFTYVIPYMAEIDPKSKRTIIENLQYLRNMEISEYKGVVSKKPKLSIVIPILNGEDYISPLVSSIQLQTMKEIEIVFVDDFSEDDTYEKLLLAQQKEPRIKIIKNKKNRGIMYSRMYGALQSIGKYVTFLDCDDLYINPNLFVTAYNTAVSKDLDLIQYEYVGSTFDGDETYDYLVAYLSKAKYDELVYPPNIKTLLFGQRDSPGGSGIVYDKLYRRNVINKMADFLGEDLVNIHLIFMEDFLISFAAFRTADSYMLMQAFGVWHWNKNPNGMTSKVSEIEDEEFVYPEYSNKKIGDYLTIWSKLFELTEDDPDEGVFRLNVLYILIVPNDLRKIFALSYHYEKLLNICRKFYSWKYITFDIKMKVSVYCQEAVKISIPMKKKYSLFFED